MRKVTDLSAKKFLGKTVTVIIDRPLGSMHPDWDFFYPLNYGFIPNEPAPDGENLDAYLLGVFEPIEHFTGQCIAFIHRFDDDDDKLIIVPNEKDYTDEQITALTEFQERFFNSIIIR